MWMSVPALERVITEGRFTFTWESWHVAVGLMVLHNWWFFKRWDYSEMLFCVKHAFHLCKRVTFDIMELKLKLNFQILSSRVHDCCAPTLQIIIELVVFLMTIILAAFQRLYYRNNTQVTIFPVWK